MLSSRSASALIVLFVVLSVAAPVAAADPPPKAEIGVSYSVLHNDIGTYPLGWVFAVDGNVTNWMAVVGEIGGNYKTLEEAYGRVTLREHSFLGGVKIASRASRAAVPFVQVLTGIGRFGGSSEGQSDSVTVFVFQPGAGVDIKIGTKAALRLQGDYQLLRKDGENLNQFRFAAGVVFGIGKR